MGRTRKRRKPGIEGDTSSLPCEIINIILSKLPVKSLFRFRCVCKSWRDTISETQFARSHLNESIKLDRQRIFLWDSQRIDSKYFYSIGYESYDASEEKLCLPWKKYMKAKVKGSCNGLVLLGLENDKMCVLWNPSTRAYSKFSCPSPNYVPGGLCYDSSMDDYKVLFFSNINFFVVFSFKGQCWTEAKEFPYSNFIHDNTVIVNGVLHLVACKSCRSSSDSDSDDDLLSHFWGPTYFSEQNNDPPTFMFESGDDGDAYKSYSMSVYIPKTLDEYVIVYFDMADEKFKEIPTPNCIHEGVEFGLTVMKGCLSLYYTTTDRNYVELWTMKQYGEHNSWTKVFVIPHWLGTRHLVHLRPLCATKKDEVVMIIDYRRTVIYNPKNNECRSLGQTELRNMVNSVLYVDSLVLPIRTPQVKGKRKKKL